MLQLSAAAHGAVQPAAMAQGVARHAALRMDATSDRIEQMIADNKCARARETRARSRVAVLARVRCLSRGAPLSGAPRLPRARKLLRRRIMLFMKGNKMFPQCGFSNTAVMILKSIPAAADFETFDVLSDNEVREGIKAYSNWPTIPQCYIDGEFIGGCDLLIEMYQNGELQEMVEKSVAS